ncbi:unnamed protein product [Lampetra fluviatilis]
MTPTIGLELGLLHVQSQLLDPQALPALVPRRHLRGFPRAEGLVPKHPGRFDGTAGAPHRPGSIDSFGNRR